jgi:hypothetical protein
MKINRLFITQAFSTEGNLRSGQFYILITLLANHDPNFCPGHDRWTEKLGWDLGWEPTLNAGK